MDILSLYWYFSLQKYYFFFEFTKTLNIYLKIFIFEYYFNTYEGKILTWTELLGSDVICFM